MKNRLRSLLYLIQVACDASDSALNKRSLIEGMEQAARTCQDIIKMSEFAPELGTYQQNLAVIIGTAEEALKSGKLDQAFPIIRDASLRVAGLPPDIS
jgi:hypothetical protein